ncbi:MAG: DUF4330 domain-containing protein [Alkaliphilus sp.]
MKHINLFDVFMLLLIAAVIVLGAKQVVFSSSTNNVADESEEIIVTLSIRGVRTATVEVIKEGDILTCVKSKEVVGTVINKEVISFQTTVETKDGKIVLANAPNRYDVIISVRGHATITDNEIMVNSTSLRTGMTLRVFTNIYEVKTTVIDIEYNK